MAPVVQELTQTIAQATTTFVTTFLLGSEQARPTANYVTQTLTYPSTTIVEINIASTPTSTQSASPGGHGGLTGTAKGAIAGSILGAFVVLILSFLCCCRQSSSSLPSSPQTRTRRSSPQTSLREPPSLNHYTLPTPSAKTKDELKEPEVASEAKSTEQDYETRKPTVAEIFVLPQSTSLPDAFPVPPTKDHASPPRTPPIAELTEVSNPRTDRMSAIYRKSVGLTGGAKIARENTSKPIFTRKLQRRTVWGGWPGSGQVSRPIPGKSKTSKRSENSKEQDSNG